MLMAIKLQKVLETAGILIANLDIDLSDSIPCATARLFLFPYAILQLLFITLLLWAMALLGATF